jgi:hypothetical protein
MAHAWRSLLFGVEGMRHYLKAGFEAGGAVQAKLCRDP